jgi:hypothetical protein
VLTQRCTENVQNLHIFGHNFFSCELPRKAALESQRALSGGHFEHRLAKNGLWAPHQICTFVQEKRHF